MRRLLVVFVAALGLATAGPARADTTVGFDDGSVATDQPLTTQYLASGVDFRADDVPHPPGGIPAVTGTPEATASAAAHTAPNVLEVAGYCGEFCSPTVVATLTDPATHVSVLPGVLAANRSATVRLSAYDNQGRLINSVTADVDSSPGFGQFVPCNFSCPLTVDTSGHNDTIRYVLLTDADTSPRLIGADDMSFDRVVTATPTYEPVWLGTQDGQAGIVNQVTVAQGRSATTPVHIVRSGGSTGDVSLALGALPDGVTGAVTRSPSAADDFTITLTAAPGATIGDATLTVTASSADPAAGTATQPVSIPITVTRVCQPALAFGVIQAQTGSPGFCVDHRASGDVYVTPDQQPVVIDGITVTPVPGAHLVFSPAAGTVAGEGGPVDAAIAGTGLLGSGVTLPRGPLDWHPGTAATTYALPAFTVGSGATVGGFHAGGTAPASLSAGAVHLTVHVQLPDVLRAAPGGPAVSGDLSMTATNTAGLALDGASIAVPHAFLGALELRDVALSYQRDGSVWEGRGTVAFPGGASIAVAPSPSLPSGGIGFSNGGFAHAGAHADFDPGVPVFTGVDITSIGFSIATRPTVLTGTVTLSAGHLLGHALARITGGLNLVFATPAEPYTLSNGQRLTSTALYASGTVTLLDTLDLAQAHLTYSLPDHLEFGGHIGTTFLDGLMSFDADADAAANLSSGAFDIESGAHVCIVGTVCAGGDFILSSVGFGACVRTALADIGGDVTWTGHAEFFWHGCDVVAVRANVAAAQAASTTRGLRVPHAMRRLVLGIRGASGAPRVELDGPHGERLRATGFLNTARALVLPVARRHETYVILGRASAGAWQVRPLAGSTPVTGIDQGRVLPRPSVHVRVSGRGATRLLRYRVAVAAGETVRFAVHGTRSFRVIGRAGSRRGKLRFAPGTDPSGHVTLEADVFDGTRLRRVLRSSRIAVPRPVAPVAPAQVGVARSAGGLDVSWRSVAGATSYAIAVTLSDGRTLSFSAPGSARALHVGDVSGAVTGSVVVVAQDAAGAAGPSRSAPVT